MRFAIFLAAGAVACGGSEGPCPSPATLRGDAPPPGFEVQEPNAANCDLGWEQRCAYEDEDGNEVLHGVSRMWRERGVLMSQSTRRHGKTIGHSQAWFCDGTPREDMHWRNGDPHGLRLWWDEPGVFGVGECYDNDVLLWETTDEAEARERKCL